MSEDALECLVSCKKGLAFLAFAMFDSSEFEYSVVPMFFHIFIRFSVRKLLITPKWKMVNLQIFFYVKVDIPLNICMYDMLTLSKGYIWLWMNLSKESVFYKNAVEDKCAHRT